MGNSSIGGCHTQMAHLLDAIINVCILLIGYDRKCSIMEYSYRYLYCLLSGCRTVVIS